jgi:hypothetical protein
MVPALRLPENGDLQIGSLRLPEGRRTLVYLDDNASSPPVAWVTITPVPDPGAVWAELSEASPHTGLVPFIARTLSGDPHRPWDDGTHPPDDYFNIPADLAAVDQIDPAVVLRTGWASQARIPSEEEEPDPWWRELARARIAPFSRDFPGLALAGVQPLNPAQVRAAVGGLAPARIGLAVAGRPADALAAMGWMPGNWVDGVEQVTAVLRSWEDRFGARLLAVGYDSFKLLAERPPRGLPAAQHVAAEVLALGPNEFTCAWDEEAFTDVSDIADSLIRSPIWGFWWD